MASRSANREGSEQSPESRHSGAKPTHISTLPYSPRWYHSQQPLLVNMAQSSARPPISHPYPPTYFANMASSQPAPYPGQRAPGAALLRGEQRESFDYERRRDERFQQSRLSNNVSEVSNRAQVGYSESHPAQSWLPSRERVQGHGQEPFQPDQAPYPSTPSPSYHSEAEPRHVNRLPHPSYSPYDNVPLPQLARESSPSESSTLGILSAQGNSKYPTRADGKPEGWTLEDDEAEREFLRTGMLDWRSMLSLKYWIRKEWWCAFANPSFWKQAEMWEVS